jgi:hypothetical protein
MRLAGRCERAGACRAIMAYALSRAAISSYPRCAVLGHCSEMLLNKSSTEVPRSSARAQGLEAEQKGARRSVPLWTVTITSMATRACAPD